MPKVAELYNVELASLCILGVTNMNTEEKATDNAYIDSRLSWEKKLSTYKSGIQYQQEKRSVFEMFVVTHRNICYPSPPFSFQSPSQTGVTRFERDSCSLESWQ